LVSRLALSCLFASHEVALSPIELSYAAISYGVRRSGTGHLNVSHVLVHRLPVLPFLRIQIPEVNDGGLKSGIQHQGGIVFRRRFGILSPLLVRHSKAVMGIRLFGGQFDVSLMRRDSIIVTA